MFINYDYSGDHGKASLFVRAYQGDQIVGDILSGKTEMVNGTGTAVVPMTYRGSEPITTDKLAVYMLNQQGQVFYLENFNKAFNWQLGQTDLTIISAGVDRDAMLLKARVKNIGCGTPAVKPLVRYLREDGRNDYATYPETLNAMTSGQITFDLGSAEDLDLWAQRITLTVNPEEANVDFIPESNYENNTYEIGPRQLKVVKILGIEIHNTLDRSLYRNPGEFELDFSISNLTNNQTDTISRNYQWHKGYHQINNLRLNVALEENDNLLVSVGGRESDRGKNPRGSWDYFTNASNEHSSDVNVEGNWKNGGEHSATQVDGIFTVFYRIIVE
jgi:hypothetical protein